MLFVWLSLTNILCRIAEGTQGNGVDNITGGRVKKYVKIGPNRSVIADENAHPTVKLFSIGGELYMQPSHEGTSGGESDENPTVVVQFDSNQNADLSTGGTSATPVAHSVPPETLNQTEDVVGG